MRLVYCITSQKYHNQDSSNLTQFEVLIYFAAYLCFPFRIKGQNMMFQPLCAALCEDDIQVGMSLNLYCVKQKRWPDWELNPGPSRHIPDAVEFKRLNCSFNWQQFQTVVSEI